MPVINLYLMPGQRTRKNRTLELKSSEYEYPKAGRYKVAVKVVDIFGNDTMKVISVSI